MQLNEIVEKILHSPVGKQVIKADQDERQAARTALVDRKKSLRAEELRGLPALRKAEDEARVRWEAKQKELEFAGQAYMAASAARSSAAYRYSSAIATIERELCATADVAVFEFVTEMDELHERERREANNPVVERSQTQELDNQGRRRFAIRSDYQSRVRRLYAIRSAQLEARDLVSLEAHDAESLARRLQGLRDLPAIELE